MPEPRIAFDAVNLRDYGTTTWTYTEKDVILYALSLGCGWSQTRFVYENATDFAPLPTFGVLTLHNGGLDQAPLQDLVPNYNPMMALHGEQYIELRGPFPAAGSIHTRLSVIDVVDKGKAAVVVLGLTSTDAATGAVIFVNEVTTFLRGSGGFGKTAAEPRSPAAVAAHPVPRRAPDAVVEEVTSPNQAALYRMTGDANPLHIDPEFAAHGGFDRPILHGLCSFGIAAKHVMQAFGGGNPASMKSVKGRFAKHVFPGETLRTEMWWDGGEIIVFQLRVVERGVLAITNAAVVFQEGCVARQPPAKM